MQNYEHDMCSTFWSLARLSFPEERSRNIGNPLPSTMHNASLDPDEHLLCFDYLYYACAQQVSWRTVADLIEQAADVERRRLQSGEYDLDYGPTWRYVMRYMWWTERIDTIATLYLREILEIAPGADIPPVSNERFCGIALAHIPLKLQYIAIHVRHGDFSQWCWGAEDPADCFAPLSVIVRRVKSVKSILMCLSPS